MQALILAAGRGSRLGANGDHLPKCLLEIGRRHLVEHQLEMLAEAGIGPTAMVVGYCADEVREVVGIRAEYLTNSQWSSTNSLYSFWMAKEWVKGPLIVLNSDILFHRDILRRLQSIDGDAIAYDSSSGDGQEHMKVQVEKGRLIGMGKDLQTDVAGENVGILKFSEETARKMFVKAGELLEQGKKKDWIGSAVCEIAREQKIHAVDINGLAWGEIDFSYDLDHVRKEVWPAIQSSRRKPARNRLRYVALVIGIIAMCSLAMAAGLRTVGELSWEHIPLDSAERVTLTQGELQKTWYQLDTQEAVEVFVSGPTRLRIDSRLLIEDPSASPAPYVLSLSVDDERIDWFKEIGVPSKSWKHADRFVCKRERVELEIAEGTHPISLELIATSGGNCLIQIRQAEVDAIVD